MSITNNLSQIARDFEYLSGLFTAQPIPTQQFLNQQAAAIVSALRQDRHPIRFQLPDKIILEGGEALDLPFPWRSRMVGSLLKRLSRTEKRTQLVQHLNTLEHGLNPGLAVCGKLFRFALARYMLHDLLPDGRPVRYQPERDDEIPSIPVDKTSATTLLAASDALATVDTANSDRGILQDPYVAAAQRFFLPQWVAFGEDDNLLAGSIQEAEALIASLQNAVLILQDAEALCPSIVADETYQRKRTGLLGQLVNQGRAMARYYTRQIITRIRSRAEAGTLNRGLHLSLPYFEINDLALHLYPIDVIPDGRIMFVSAFVVRALQLTEAKVRHDVCGSISSRRHLLAQFSSIENAFIRHSSK